MNEFTVVYFNNCTGRDHVAIYGHGAFFDLDVTRWQSEQAVNLPVGQKCVVARYGEGGKIVFDWFSFLSEAIRPDKTNDNTLHRVMFGDLLSTEMLTKPDAGKSDQYRAFFDVNGHFKRTSVIYGDVVA